MENQHIDFDGAIYGVDGAFDSSFDPNRQTYNFSHTWPLPISPGSMHQQQHHDGSQQQQQHQHQNQRRITNAAASSSHSSHPSTTSMAPLHHNMGLGFPAAMQPMNPMLATWMNINTDGGFAQDSYGQGMGMGNDFNQSYGGQLQTSPVEFGINPAMMNSMNNSMSMAPMNFMTTTSMELPTLTTAPFGMADFQQEFTNMPANAPEYTVHSNAATAHSVSTGSPGESLMDIRSLSSSDNGWVEVGFNPRNSYDFSDNAIIFNPAQSLHIRTGSGSSDSAHSDVPRSAHSFSSFEEIQFPMHSPQSETDNTLDLVHSHHGHSDSCSHGHSHSHSYQLSDHDFPSYISPTQSVSPPMARVEPITIKQSSSNTASPTSSAVSSPPARRRKSPITATGSKPTKTIVKKATHTTKKDATGEKRVGRRRGPLRPDQRQQAHEIRKLRACLRCKFLKKTCDKGDPCAGCQPSHARLWQVPCTRIDIKDIAYFMKDWKADYERHVSLGFSIGNIKGFSTSERLIYVTHGYGHYLPIMAREVYVRDEKCFGVDWHETLNGLHFEINTAKLSAGMEGISRAMLSDYLDRHIDGGFEQFVDEYFEGTFFVTELLKTAYRFYCREKLPVIRKALKLVLAYNLTLHVTMVEGLGEEDNTPGKVEDQQSKFSGKTIAPVMINFQVKCALADMWRELQKDVLEELSSLYQSVYSGDKLKNWPTIFMLAAILLAVWELIQFDCNYRVPDAGAVNKFCGEMEGTPVGVIVGLFSAISQKLPSFTEWDSRKHHHLLNSNPAVCDAMTEVRAHVTKYEPYLRSRSDCKFDRTDFDSLSNKFLSKLVIRAN
ncbi:c6 finger domain-containing protein [Stemphylium lycopersici]|uniref:C6 finger domain-containing protein n=1 Tax=Stemphylium lycopersici TaxID=183478 RepID=A0A364MYA8_STELY|nr:c6 finger domain-containing protein [Stemphylium lycopersici]